MHLVSNTDYVYKFGGDLFVTHHTEHNYLNDYLKLTNIDFDNPCIPWTYDPTSPSHKNVVFHELEAYKLQHPELFI